MISRRSIWSEGKLIPVLSIIGFIVIIWYVFSIVLNAPWEYDKAKRSSITLSNVELISNTWSQKRPKLPTPHQVTKEIWDTTVNKKVTSKRSLVYHGLITFYETIYGFVFSKYLESFKTSITFLNDLVPACTAIPLGLIITIKLLLFSKI